MWFWRLALGLLVAAAPVANVGYAQAKKKEAPKKAAPAKKEAPAAEEPAASDTPHVETKKEEHSRKSADKAEPAYMHAWGMAGCGLGGLILGKNNTKGAQIGAWFLNTLGYQVSAISCTKSSGCEVGPDLRTAQVEQKVFVDVNIANLSREAAQGGGQHLSAFAAILGCDGDARTRFIQVSHDRYGEIFSTDDPEQVLHNYRATIQGDSELADQCSRITT